MNRKFLDNSTIFLLYTTIIVFFCTEIILDITPPISRDALIHHLAVPKLWLKHGRFYEIPWAEYSYYPMNIDLLYTLCLYFKNDIAPKIIHLGFGFATSWLIYFYLKKKFSRKWGLLGMVFFSTTPIVVWLSTSAYVDLGMTFFTTGSVLALLRWRDSDYNHFGWLLISSLCMGIAIGSKYNALIAWFIVNLTVMFSYVRDTSKQLGALKYSMVFLIVTAIVASPWYFKNFLLTGNPFYPLFSSFFKFLHHHPVPGVLHGQAIIKSEKISFFEMRKVMYGENFWETLLIPIRMFFQGKDNSYQYFQGVLNPILIVFSPLIFFNKRYAKDKFIFVFFTVFFIIAAYFLTDKQVRYILPAIPFLAIIAVMGIKDLLDIMTQKTFFSSPGFGEKIKSIAKMVVFTSVAILLIFSFIYLSNRTEMINPFPYVLGKETRVAFLKHHLLHYDAVEYINNNLPMDAMIFTMFLGRRGYYLERAYQNEPSFGMSTLRNLVKCSNNEKQFVKTIRSMNSTHILMQSDLFHKFLRDNFLKEDIIRFMNLVNKYWSKIFEKNGYSVWAVHIRQ